MWISLLYISCSNSNGDTDISIKTSEVKTPEASALVFPLKDEICNTGVFISEVESKVEFEWNTTKNTDSYEIVLKDLNTNQETKTNSTTTTKVITLKQNTPYSWKVTSKSNATQETGVSDEWQFYNASQGVKNYAPFPAKLVSPNNDNIITTATVNLEWQGVDGDGESDIELYRIFFGQENPPVTLLNTTTSSTFTTDNLTSGVYYWSVTTVDKSGNKTSSQVSSFTVN